MRGNVLRSYRELLTLLRRLSNDAQSAAGKEAKSKILAHKDETDSLKISDLHKQLIAKISFLRMTTTRIPGEKSRQASGTFILRKGDLVATETAIESRCDDVCFTIDRHLCTTSHLGQAFSIPCLDVELLPAK